MIALTVWFKNYGSVLYPLVWADQPFENIAVTRVRLSTRSDCIHLYHLKVLKKVIERVTS